MKQWSAMLPFGLLFAWPNIVHTQVKPADILDSLMRGLGGDSTPAVGIAVVHQGRVVYERETGWSDLGQHVAAGRNTRFLWASIAKQFTAFGISRLVERGVLSLDAPASRYLPELAQVNEEITLRTLLHHTSGLEDSDGLLALSGFMSSDALSREQIAAMMLRQRHLRFRPGSAHAYSNGGYVLLAEVIERVTGTPFSDWMDKEVFSHIGMARSGIVSTTDRLVPDEAKPYLRDADGLRLDLYVDTPGAGALRATMGDMARWAAHVMEPTWERHATGRLRERGVLRSGDSLSYAWGLGWGTYRGLQTLTHGGSTPAVDAFILMIPSQQFAVVVAAAGQVSPNPGALAYRAVEAWLSDKLQAPVAQKGPRMMMITEEMMQERAPESQGVRVSDSTLRAARGRYRMADGTLEVVRLNGRSGRLEVARDGVTPWWPLSPLADGRFVTMPRRIAYSFVANTTGAITGVRRSEPSATLQQTAGEMVGVREAEVPFTDESAAPYVGWYYSPETLAWFEVLLRESHLVLRHPRFGEIPMARSQTERFVMESTAIVGAQFTMSPSGEATGVVLEARSWGTRTAFQRISQVPGSAARRP